MNTSVTIVTLRRLEQYGIYKIFWSLNLNQGFSRVNRTIHHNHTFIKVKTYDNGVNGIVAARFLQNAFKDKLVIPNDLRYDHWYRLDEEDFKNIESIITQTEWKNFLPKKITQPAETRNTMYWLLSNQDFTAYKFAYKFGLSLSIYQSAVQVMWNSIFSSNAIVVDKHLLYCLGFKDSSFDTAISNFVEYIKSVGLNFSYVHYNMENRITKVQFSIYTFEKLMDLNINIDLKEKFHRVKDVVRRYRSYIKAREQLIRLERDFYMLYSKPFESLPRHMKRLSSSYIIALEQGNERNLMFKTSLYLANNSNQEKNIFDHYKVLLQKQNIKDDGKYECLNDESLDELNSKVAGQGNTTECLENVKKNSDQSSLSSSVDMTNYENNCNYVPKFDLVYSDNNLNGPIQANISFYNNNIYSNESSQNLMLNPENVNVDVETLEITSKNFPIQGVNKEPNVYNEVTSVNSNVFPIYNESTVATSSTHSNVVPMYNQSDVEMSIMGSCSPSNMYGEMAAIESKIVPIYPESIIETHEDENLDSYKGPFNNIVSNNPYSTELNIFSTEPICNEETKTESNVFSMYNNEMCAKMASEKSNIFPIDNDLVIDINDDDDCSAIMQKPSNVFNNITTSPMSSPKTDIEEEVEIPMPKLIKIEVDSLNNDEQPTKTMPKLTPQIDNEVDFLRNDEHPITSQNTGKSVINNTIEKNPLPKISSILSRSNLESSFITQYLNFQKTYPQVILTLDT